MEYCPHPRLNVGDRVLTPYGVAQVTGIDFMRDGIVTTKGSWGYEELEELPRPDLTDVDAVEDWLTIAARIIPKAQIVATTTECKGVCNCTHCYLVKHWIPEPGASLQDSYHFRNNDACQCVTKGCTCLS